jgi:hypothetical protein
MLAGVLRFFALRMLRRSPRVNIQPASYKVLKRDHEFPTSPLPPALPPSLFGSRARRH